MPPEIMHNILWAFLCVLSLQRESGGFIRFSEESAPPQVLTGGQGATCMYAARRLLKRRSGSGVLAECRLVAADGTECGFGGQYRGLSHTPHLGGL